MSARLPGARAATLAARALALSVVLAALPTPRPAAAQSCTDCERPVPPWERRQRPAFGVAAGGLYSSLDGGDFRRVADGFGFDAQAFVGVSAFALGVGYQRTSHAVSGTTDGTAIHHGPFVEPRLAFPLGYGAFTPYVAGRVARLTRSASSLGAFDGGRQGVQLGAGGGVMVMLARGTALDVGATYSRLRFDGAAGGDARGGGVLLRAGLVVSAGGGR